MSYELKNFETLIGLPGFSDQLLKNHFTLYQGYINNFNKLNDILVQIEKEDRFGTPEFAELNRHLGWEFNGLRLHEYYFKNLTNNSMPLEKNSSLITALEKEFGNFSNFEKDFKSMGVMRGIGWVILYYDALGDRLFNVWINEHDVGHFAGCVPLLVLDVFEHAYMVDYGLKRADYIESFWKAIDWATVKSRFEAAIK